MVLVKYCNLISRLLFREVHYWSEIGLPGKQIIYTRHKYPTESEWGEHIWYLDIAGNLFSIIGITKGFPVWHISNMIYYQYINMILCHMIQFGEFMDLQPFADITVPPTLAPINHLWSFKRSKKHTSIA
jgi:hypothetical protein